MYTYEIYAMDKCRPCGCYTANTEKDALRLFVEAHGFHGKYRKRKDGWYFYDQYGTEYYARSCWPMWL